jgi:hypothetical protein
MKRRLLAAIGALVLGASVMAGVQSSTVQSNTLAPSASVVGSPGGAKLDCPDCIEWTGGRG